MIMIELQKVIIVHLKSIMENLLVNKMLKMNMTQLYQPELKL